MDLKESRVGFWQPQVGYKSFQPHPINHTFTWADSELNVLLEEATLKLGELNTYSELAPSIDLFIQMHVVKEATQSSRIEGTKTAMDEALLRKEDLQPERRDDWDEVHNYIEAMNRAIAELATLPLSLRLLRHTHQQLMQGVRGQHKNPGEFRTSQNWIGGASLRDAAFVPPHHLDVQALMGDLEAFLHNTDARVPHLIKIAIAHYQFETIHPFLDGNGRLGRLLITLYLVSNGILRRPVLYLSDFLEKNKPLYYDNPTGVRTHNNLNQWLRFFLVAVAETCTQALTTLKQVLALKQQVEGERIHPLGRRIPQAQQLLQLFYQRPVLSARDVVQALGARLPPSTSCWPTSKPWVFYAKPLATSATGCLCLRSIWRCLRGRRNKTAWAFHAQSVSKLVLFPAPNAPSARRTLAEKHCYARFPFSISGPRYLPLPHELAQERLRFCAGGRRLQ